MTSALRAMVDAQAGTFQHYLWYYRQQQRLAVHLERPRRRSARPRAAREGHLVQRSVSCVVLVQEPGHNFGMQHSSSLACGTRAFADDPNGCTDSEYGDRSIRWAAAAAT